MLHVYFHDEMRHQRRRELDRALEQRRRLTENVRPAARDIPPLHLTVLCAEDDPGVRRLAALNEVPAPHGRHLVAALGSETVAAIGLADRRLLRDPFKQTADLVPLLKLRASSLARGA